MRPFGSRIQIFDPYLDEAPADVEKLSLDQLLATSDVVTIHTPLTEATRDLIGRRELGLVQRSAILVNTARAGIVNQAALREALVDGKLAGAALDVFDNEPLDADDELVRSDRTTLTPHLAGTTRAAFTEGPRRIAEHLRRLA